MKKIVMTMVALLTMTAAMAQQSDNKERRAPKKIDAQEMTDCMAKELNLDDAQKAKVLALNKEYEDVIGGPGMHRGPRGGHHGPRPDAKKDAKTDAQTGASEQAQKQQAGERRQRPELTEEQKAEMKQRMAKREEYDKKLKEILTEEQQKALQKRHHGGLGHGSGPRKTGDNK